MSEKSDVAKREEEVLAFWNEQNIFAKSLDKEAPEGEYIFIDGPPFATGTPHYGHLLQSALKDVLPRFKTMRGYHVPRRWGWDCHGLPIENIVEKELGTKSKKDILDMGVKKFNDLCRDKIFTYMDVWNEFVPRFGRWVDMDNPYRTMDKEYMESEWWAFKELYDKGLIYEDYRSMHICPRCETTLAQAEVSEGYEMVKDWAVTVKFPLKDEPNTSLLAWTTTPWTLPGNVAIAVHNEVVYAKVAHEDHVYILAKDLVEQVFEGKEYSIAEELKGSELVGKEYIPPFDSFVNDETLKHKENAWKVYHADFVNTEQGTGIAHEAPAFGADDMELAQAVGLPLIQHVGMNGVIVDAVEELKGLHVKPKDDAMATDVEVIKYLAGKDLLFAKEKYEHSYPHCWRCDTPLLNYATSSWFVAVEKIKNTLLETSEHTSWNPAHFKGGRWGEWLKGARDWGVSRQRFWANTIPVWRCKECKKDRVFGSARELEEASGATVTDLHKDVVDEITVPCECGSVMHRDPDVLDTWFDSGSAPYATQHYPFENKEVAEGRIPADFIAEGLDQVSKWFYYQHVLSTALFEKNAFKNVMASGIILAEDGKKMSKRLQNYPDPTKLINAQGADAVRMYILSSPVVRGENLNFTEAGVAQLSNKVIGRLHNVYSLYEMYKGEVPHEDSDTSDHVLDRWIVNEFQRIQKEVTSYMDAYELDKAVRVTMEFVDDLSTWYVRRSRDRFKGEDADDKKKALETTRWVFRKYAKILAPFGPFYADWLWDKVRRESDPESVHLSNWCTVRDADDTVLTHMRNVREAVTLALEARASAGIKVRQPLQAVTLKDETLKGKDALLELLRDEVNVKEILFDASLAEEVLLDTTISLDLREEGEVRDLIRHIQASRKHAGLTPSDTPVLEISTTEEGQVFIEKNKAELILATSLGDIEFAVFQGEPVKVGDKEFVLRLK